MQQHTPDGILDFWLSNFRGREWATEEEWRERMLRWRIGCFARNWEDKAFTNAQRRVCEQIHRQGMDNFFSPSSTWDTPSGWLARLIILDQFGRCVYRGTPAAYENDRRTAKMVQTICERGWDRSEYTVLERLWVYVALSHPEVRALQELSVKKLTEWSNDLVEATPPSARRTSQKVGWTVIKACIEHSEAVLEHGRFPHRNAILCRPHGAGEAHYLTSHLRPLWSFTQPPRPDYYAVHGALHASGDADCRSITADDLTRFQAHLGLSSQSAGCLNELLSSRRTASFNDLFRHLMLEDSAQLLHEVSASPAVAQTRAKVNFAIFRDPEVEWPPRSSKTSVPRLIDVPDLNMAVRCPHLSNGDVLISRQAISRFVKATGFRRQPFRSLYQRYRDEFASHALYEFGMGPDGPTTSVSLSKRQFRSLVQDLFADSPARSEIVDRIYDLMDLDGNGALDPVEVLVALNVLCEGDFNDRVNVAFDAFDRDRSGTLDNEELHELVHTTLLRGLHLVESLFQAYESPSAPADCVKAFSLCKLEDIEQTAKNALREADTNGDGLVDQSEFRAWIEAHPLLRQFFELSDRIFTAERRSKPRRSKRAPATQRATTAPL